MGKYAFWDKKTPIYTPAVDRNTGKGVWTAEEYISNVAPWAANPGVKVIVSNGAINGAVFMEFEATKNIYKKMGANITEEMSDDEVLSAMEDFENNPPVSPPSPEERIAAAMEYQNIMSSL